MPRRLKSWPDRLRRKAEEQVQRKAKAVWRAKAKKEKKVERAVQKRAVEVTARQAETVVIDMESVTSDRTCFHCWSTRACHE